MLKNFIRINIGFIVVILVFTGAVMYFELTGADPYDFYNYENIQRGGFMGFSAVNLFINALVNIGSILETLYTILSSYLQPMFNMIYNIFEFIINSVMSVFDFISSVYEKIAQFVS